LNRLASILDAGDVEVDVVARSKPALFVEAARVFKRHGGSVVPSAVTDGYAFARAAIAMSSRLSTAPRMEVAASSISAARTHGRLPGLKPRPAAVVIRVCALVVVAGLKACATVRHSIAGLKACATVRQLRA